MQVCEQMLGKDGITASRKQEGGDVSWELARERAVETDDQQTGCSRPLGAGPASQRSSKEAREGFNRGGSSDPRDSVDRVQSGRLGDVTLDLRATRLCGLE